MSFDDADLLATARQHAFEGLLMTVALRSDDHLALKARLLPHFNALLALLDGPASSVVLDVHRAQMLYEQAERDWEFHDASAPFQAFASWLEDHFEELLALVSESPVEPPKPLSAPAIHINSRSEP